MSLKTKMSNDLREQVIILLLSLKIGKKLIIKAGMKFVRVGTRTAKRIYLSAVKALALDPCNNSVALVLKTAGK
jgi:hypothetical protein